MKLQQQNYFPLNLGNEITTIFLNRGNEIKL